MKIGKVVRHDEPKLIQLSVEQSNFDRNLPLVLLREEAWYEMWKHAIEEKHHEVTGYLLGLPLVDIATEVKITYVEKVIRGLYDSTSTFFSSRHEIFGVVNKICAETGLILVGYYHSHPNMSVFQSGTDVKNFKDFYSAPYNIAPVVAPSYIDCEIPRVYDERTGIFVWNTKGNPVRLSKENLMFTKKRPEIVEGTQQKEQEERIPDSGYNLKAGIASDIWRISRLLAESADQFKAEFLTVIISQKTFDQLTNLQNSEGVLLGSACNFGGYDFFCVHDLAPITLEELQEWNEYLEKPVKPLSEESFSVETSSIAQGGVFLANKEPIGFFCSEKKMQQIELTSRSKWNPLNLRNKRTNLCQLVAYCRGFCLIGVSEQLRMGKVKTNYKVWYDEERKLTEIPSQHLLILGDNEL